MFGMAGALMDKNLLILDLDETLLYGTERPLDREPDLLASGYFVYFRAGPREFHSPRRVFLSPGSVDFGIQRVRARDLGHRGRRLARAGAEPSGRMILRAEYVLYSQVRPIYVLRGSILDRRTNKLLRSST
jgi:hypothetical protein